MDSKELSKSMDKLNRARTASRSFAYLSSIMEEQKENAIQTMIYKMHEGDTEFSALVGKLAALQELKDHIEKDIKNGNSAEDEIRGGK